ncbi:MAG: hypothetical protein C0481_15395 [Phenylobacterium sp.]|uniref:hypothetical protein n=1 Tax=Phenylobacterium sp. TaxID=1871053 RepID=UPI0025E3E138|nr:hypothetical protein [Phenylobacterium sp.]MBA4013250.1 hypothetical protein [Phenylobacterium sp.]
MRTQNDNPAFQAYRHLLPASGRYPAKWVDIFSNTNDEMRYCDVEVVFIPRDADIEFDLQFWDAFADYNDRWIGDLGNSVAGWMEPHGLNPAKVFGLMLYNGFVDQNELDMALSEFSHIEECGWAREMVDGLLAEPLHGGAHDPKVTMAALEKLVDEGHGQWARDMLVMMRDEAEL